MGVEAHLPTSGPSNISALFGDDVDSLPLWFKKEVFLSKDFDAEAYVNDLRRFVPLETFRNELSSHLSGLKNELVELINRDYNDFVNLSTKLVDVDGAVLRMRMPLNELRNKLLAVRDSISVSLSAVQDGLQRRAETASAREMLELLLDTSHVVSKVEKLLVELENMPASDSAESAGAKASSASLAREDGVGLEEQRSRLLERIASEMNRLQFYVAKAKALPFIQTMEKRIQSSNQKLKAHLRNSFVSGLGRRDRPIIYHSLRAYAAIDDPEGAEEAFRAAIVATLMQQIVPPQQGKVSPGGDSLADVYGEISKKIKEECTFLLDITFTANSGLHAFDFLANSILKEVQSALAKGKPGAFSPGKPAEFLQNFKASLRFLSSLEGYCPTRSAVNGLRSSAAYEQFMKQWNLPVYFTLRFQEIAGALDTALPSSGSFPVSKPSEEGLALQPSAVLWEQMKRCWDDDVFLKSAADRFLRLALQLLARYTTWLLGGLQARKAGGEAALPSTSEDLILLRHDVWQLAELIKGPYIERLTKQLDSVPESVIKGVEQSVIEGLAKLEECKQPLTDVLTDAVAEKCYEVVKQLRGITATYRMTNKPLPTRHSHYVGGILTPLKVLVDSDRSAYLDRAARQELIEEVVKKVTARFDETARDLVTSVRKAESSLKRLRTGAKGRGGGGDAGGGVASDTDKICAQLFLDVQEYGRQITKFGVDAKELPAYQSLWQGAALSEQQSITL